VAVFFDSGFSKKKPQFFRIAGIAKSSSVYLWNLCSPSNDRFEALFIAPFADGSLRSLRFKIFHPAR
jgi:hypothetical protein